MPVSAPYVTTYMFWFSKWCFTTCVKLISVLCHDRRVLIYVLSRHACNISVLCHDMSILIFVLSRHVCINLCVVPWCTCTDVRLVGYDMRVLICVTECVYWFLHCVTACVYWFLCCLTICIILCDTQQACTHFQALCQYTVVLVFFSLQFYYLFTVCI